MFRTSLLLISILVLTGCFWNASPEPIEVSYTEVERPELIVPETDIIIPRDVEWILITKENAEEVLNELDRQGRPVVLFTLRDKDYENLALNLQDIMTLVEQQQAIIAAYKRYYTQSVETIETTNRKNRESANDINERLREQD